MFSPQFVYYSVTVFCVFCIFNGSLSGSLFAGIIVAFSKKIKVKEFKAFETSLSVAFREEVRMRIYYFLTQD